MKKVLICLVFISIVISMFVFLKKSNDAAITFSLINDIADYIDFHKSNYPPDWEGFCVWSNQKNGNERWKVEELSSRFALPWSKDARYMKENDTFIIVLDSSFKNLSVHINKDLGGKLAKHRLKAPQN